MNNYLSGDKNRIFINSRIGCSLKCTYCYLPLLKLEDTGAKTADEIISLVELFDDFRKGIDGTIVSLGCYSECWDSANKETTKKLIEFFLRQGNPVQLATKKQIFIYELTDIKKNILWKNQFSIFISIPTISYHYVFENGTTSVKDRMLNFEIQKVLDIPIILYIKPVLNNFTIKDIDKYIQLIKEYNITSIVIGSLFEIDSKSKELAPVGNKRLYYCTENTDEEIIIDQLSRYCNVYKKSSDYILEKVKENGIR